MTNSNVVICRNEVVVEGVNVGEFESFSLKSNRQTLGTTAVLTLPLYAVGIETPTSQGAARARVRRTVLDEANKLNIKPCAEVDVYCWYEGYEKTLVFHGFIEHVAEGFPTKLYLRDGSFILRFGAVSKTWDDKATLQRITKDCIAISQKAFTAERERLGFERPIKPLRYSVSGKNVQAVTTPLSFDNFASGRAPFEVIQYLMQLLVLYGGVDNDNNVFVGAGVADSTREAIKLSTRYNVVERDIVPTDGRFVDYDVKVTGVLKNGKKYTATGGLKNVRSKQSTSALDKVTGETYRGYCIANTAEGIQSMADRLLAKLKGTYNKGTITLLMYPKCQLLDHVDYDDTVFDIFDAKYYVTGYSFSASEKGYFQTLEVTDRVFML